MSERAWGTVREDYSADGDAWAFFPHDHARSRAYRWNEDGLAGICDDRQLLCFAPALWNGRDRFLKERLFGLAGPEGNHGEDVKECWWYLDSTPTHSWMRWRYMYPQAEFPYERLRLIGLFRRRPDGTRPVFGEYRIPQQDPAWRDLILFHEYFHGDTGAGLGASHQTGWTGLVANLILSRDRT